MEMKINANPRKIVERGAVIATYPYDGSWQACVRYDGDTYGRRVGPVFTGDGANDRANRYADTYQ